jgi:uncharacterized protein YkwD
MRRGIPVLMIVAVLIALAIPAAGQSAGKRCANTDATPTAQNRTKIAKAVECLIQERRVARHLKRFHHDFRLRRAAQKYADLMGSERFFAHYSPGGSSPCSRTAKEGYKAGPGGVGEALSYTIGSSTPVKLVDELLSNNAHRVIIFSKSFRDIGIGVVAEPPVQGDTRPGATIVADVARKRSKGQAALRC